MFEKIFLHTFKLNPLLDSISIQSGRLASRKQELTNNEEEVEEQERRLLPDAGGEENMLNHYGNQNSTFSKKERQSNPVVQLCCSGVCLKAWVALTHLHTLVDAALFTTARKRNQPRCPLAAEGMKKIWHPYIWSFIQQKMMS